MSVYIITTDASWNLRTGKAAFAFQLKTGGQIFAQHAALITNTCLSPTEAELMAVGHAVNALINLVPMGEGDIVFIYTDCAVAVRYITHMHQQGLNPRLRALRNIVHRLFRTVPNLRHRAELSDPTHFALKWCHNACKALTSYGED